MILLKAAAVGFSILLLSLVLAALRRIIIMCKKTAAVTGPVAAVEEEKKQQQLQKKKQSSSMGLKKKKKKASDSSPNHAAVEPPSHIISCSSKENNNFYSTPLVMPAPHSQSASLELSVTDSRSCTPRKTSSANDHENADRNQATTTTTPKFAVPQTPIRGSSRLQNRGGIQSPYAVGSGNAKSFR